MIWIGIAFIAGIIIGMAVMACFAASGRVGDIERNSETEPKTPPDNWRGEEAIREPKEQDKCGTCDYFDFSCMSKRCKQCDDDYNNFEPQHKEFCNFDEGQE